MPKPKVDKEKCIGCGACVSLCPNIFKIMEDGKSHVITEDCGGCDCQQVVDNCPVNAISIEKTEK
mgnify:CR=1 FL=1